MSYDAIATAVYRDAQRVCGIKVGDWVRVDSRAESYSYGWTSPWNSHMDRIVGAVGRVETIYDDRRVAGILVDFSQAFPGEGKVVYNLPYFILEKFDAPKFVSFKPYDKVLVRDNCEQKWQATFFSYFLPDALMPFVTTNGVCYRHCIPFEGNEHLVGTTDNPQE